MRLRLPQPLFLLLTNIMLRSPIVFKPIFTTALRLMNMPLSVKFASYAMEFERSLRTDNWEKVARHFAPDAVYEVRNMGLPDASISGRSAIIEGIRRSLNGFDRRLKRKVYVTRAPHEVGNTLTCVWVGEYSRPTAPPIKLSAHLTAKFRGGLMIYLVDDYLPGMDAADWLDAHGSDLAPAYVGIPVAATSTRQGPA